MVHPSADQYHAIVTTMLDGSLTDIRERTGHMDPAEALIVVKTSMKLIDRRQLEDLAAAALLRLSRAAGS